VERSETQHRDLGFASLHPTYEKMLKTGFLAWEIILPLDR
jgi:hypothetical protein